MSKFKYNSSQEVAAAILSKSVKRNSVLVMKRQNKTKGNLEYAKLLQEGVDEYDIICKGKYHCSYYNKDINSLTLYELVKLDEDKPALFSYYHTVRYSILMLGSSDTVDSYKGNLITPSEFSNF